MAKSNENLLEKLKEAEMKITNKSFYSKRDGELHSFAPFLSFKDFSHEENQNKNRVMQSNPLLDKSVNHNLMYESLIEKGFTKINSSNSLNLNTSNDKLNRSAILKKKTLTPLSKSISKNKY